MNVYMQLLGTYIIYTHESDREVVNLTQHRHTKMQEMSKNIQPSYINYDIHTFHSYFLYLFVAFIIIIIIIINRFYYYIKEGRVVLGQVRVLRVWMGVCFYYCIVSLSWQMLGGKPSSSMGATPRWRRQAFPGAVRTLLYYCPLCCVLSKKRIWIFI